MSRLLERSCQELLGLLHVNLDFFLLFPNIVGNPRNFDCDGLFGGHHVTLKTMMNSFHQIFQHDVTLYIFANCPSSRYDRPLIMLESRSLEGWVPPIILTMSGIWKSVTISYYKLLITIISFHMLMLKPLSSHSQPHCGAAALSRADAECVGGIVNFVLVRGNQNCVS